MKEQNMLMRITTSVSRYHYVKLYEESRKRDMTLSRFVGAILDRAVEFGIYDVADMRIPRVSDEVAIEYAEEGGKFLDFLKKSPFGFSKELLIHLRHDIGIEDREILLKVLAYCLKSGVVVEYKPVHKKGYVPGHIQYKLKETKSAEFRRRKTSEYERYLKLRKIYEKEI